MGPTVKFILACVGACMMMVFAAGALAVFGRLLNGTWALPDAGSVALSLTASLMISDFKRALETKDPSNGRE